MAEASDDQQSTLTQITDDPRYRQLVRERSRFSWLLTCIMLAIFFGYILMIAFVPHVLARKVSDTMTLGIPLGIGVILSGIVLTGIYVHRANSRFDPMLREILRGLRQ